MHRARNVLSKCVPELVSMVEQGSIAVSVADQIASLPATEQKVLVQLGAKDVRQKASQLRADGNRKTKAPGAAADALAEKVDQAAAKLCLMLIDLKREREDAADAAVTRHVADLRDAGLYAG